MNKGLTIRINFMPMMAITDSETMRASSLIRDTRATITNLETKQHKTVSGWGDLIKTIEKWQREHLKRIRK
jgi:hypothetical protein